MQAKSFDFLGVRARHPIKEVLKSRFGAKFIGGRCNCPLGTHADTNPSFSVFRDKTGLDRYKCHSCDAGGDVIELVQKVQGLEKMAAVEWLDGTQTRQLPAPVKQSVPAVTQRAYTNIPMDYPLPRPGDDFRYRDRTTGEWKKLYHPITFVHEYLDQAGERLGIVVRCDFIGKNGKPDKVILPLRYSEGDLYGEGWPEKPIYGLWQLTEDRSRPVFLVEGEKCVDLPLEMGLDASAHWITWQSGVHSWKYVDFSCLEGRDVVLWPDNDVGGIEVMNLVAEKIAPLARTVQVLKPEAGWPEKYDVADMLRDIRDRGGKPSDVLSWTNRSENAVVVKGATVNQRVTLPAEIADPSWMNGLEWVWTEKGAINPTDEGNIWTRLKHDPRFKGQFQFDTFDQIILFRGAPFDGAAARDLSNELRHSYPTLKPKFKDLKEAADDLSKGHEVCRFRDWLMGLTWDGVKRIQPEGTLSTDRQGLLVEYANAPNDGWSQIVGLRWMLGLVGRIIKPGHQHDALLVLEGSQGVGKTSFFRTLAQVADRDLYTDFNGSSMGTNKDDLLKLKGKAIVEMGEMTAHKRSDQDAFKAFVTNLKDTYRRPYAAESVSIPRQFVFCGTTNNETGYLNDPTGNRRIWPVKVQERIDLTKLDAKTVEQIWAEAVACFTSDDPAINRNFLARHEEEVHGELIKERMEQDPWVPKIEKMFTTGEWSRRGPIWDHQIWQALGMVDSKDQTPQAMKRLKAMMLSEPFNMKYRRLGKNHAERVSVWRT